MSAQNGDAPVPTKSADEMLREARERITELQSGMSTMRSEIRVAKAVEAALKRRYRPRKKGVGR